VNYIFLDIDGVLTSARVYRSQPKDSYKMWTQFDPIAVQFLNRIHENKPVEFVFSSTWTNWKSSDPMYRHLMESALRNAGFTGNLAEKWVIPDPIAQEGKQPPQRGRRICQYMSNVEGQFSNDFIAFDDDYHDFRETLAKKNYVITDPQEGMLTKHMKKAMSLIGDWR